METSTVATKFDSPALKCQTADYYPASWRGKVPARVRMCKTVTADFIVAVASPDAHPVAQNDADYDVWVNSQGAVAAIFEDGRQLGLRPYEFEIIEWHDSP